MSNPASLPEHLQQKRIGVYLPNELVDWIDARESNRSRLVRLACELYRLTRVLTDLGPTLGDLTELSNTELRGRRDYFKAWLIERERQLLNAEEYEHARNA